MTKLRILRWVYSRLSEWAQCNYKVSHKREPRSSQSKTDSDVMTRTRNRKRFEDAISLTLKIEKGSHKPTNTGSF